METYSSSVKTNTNIAKENEPEVDPYNPFITKEFNDLSNNYYLPKPMSYSNGWYPQFGQPYITPEGIITLFISEDIRVDISTNHSICVTTPQSKASVDCLGDNIGVIHPFGRVFKESDVCHIESGIHLAKMSGRGITFTSINRTVIYLVDSSGCKTRSERFRPLIHDFTADIFNANSFVVLPNTYTDLCRQIYNMTEDGTDNTTWVIAGMT